MVRLASGRHRSSSPRTRRRSTRTSSTSTSTAAPCPRSGIELRDVVLFWVEQGVKIFRVDNPHTKPFPFWEWMIREVNDRHPDVIFLAEAFTRPKMMKKLAKIGFQQSYTYFTWRNTKQELIEYMTELARTEMGEYYRPNFFANTPDINPYYLQTSGPAGLHRARHARGDAVERLRHLQRLRALRGQARSRARRNISTPRNTSSRPGTSTGRATSGSTSAAQPDPAREPGALGLPQHQLPQRLERPDPRLCADHAGEGQLRPRPRQPRPAQPSGMHLRGSALGVRPARSRRDRGRRPADGGRFTLHGKTHRIALDPAERPVVDLAAHPARRAGLDGQPSMKPEFPRIEDVSHDRPQRHALVPRRHHLPAARQVVLRLERRRRRRFRGRDAQARLHQGPRRHRDLGDAVLPLAAAGRRLRHRRLPRHQPGLRHDARLPPLRAGGA